MISLLAFSGLILSLALPTGGAPAELPPAPAPAPTPVSEAPAAPAIGTEAAPQARFTSRRITVEVRGPQNVDPDRPVRDVILIPGLASTSLVWEPVAQRLSETYRVHLVSVRGFGDLAAGDNGTGLVAGPVAEEVARYIRSQRLRAPAVIGHSMGGQIAVRLASDGRSGVGRIMIVDAAPFFPALLDDRATGEDLQPIAAIAYQAVLFLGDDALSRQVWAEGMGSTSEALESWVGWQGGDARVLAQSLYEVMTVDLRPRLARIDVPVTVVYGWSRREDSPRYRLQSSWRQAWTGLPRPPRLVPIAGAEHMVMIDQPARFMAAVDEFLGAP
ncbi:alpha/beta fold hydrolase [Brevundimonas poindexterae]|uniref:alpha/beta fold hydrolase n=1 Tax=Brevundimonas poindexterae TaxID=74325 RepID=UPI001CFD1061|nr:alpha/beta hydrolase [Brevundimonas poindexterae]